MNNNTAAIPALNWSKKDMTVAEKLKEAISNAKAIKLRDDMDYFESCCRQRTPGDSIQSGSVFCTQFVNIAMYTDVNDWKQVETTLFGDCLHSWQPYADCPNLTPGCEAFILRADRPVGYLGVGKLSDLRPDHPVYLTDPKNTGFVTPAAPDGTEAETKVHFVVAIVGDEGGKPTLFTFHPGDPVQPSKLKMDLDINEMTPWGIETTAAKAIAMGFETCKLGLK